MQEVIAALRKVQAEAQAAGRKSARSFSDFSSVLGSARGLLAQLGVALSAGAFIGFIRNAARAGEEVANLGQRTGRATENMLALSLVASRTNTDVEQLAKSVIFLQKNVRELQENRGDAPELFKQLGVTLRDLEGKDAAAQYDLVANAIAGLADSGEKALLTVLLLGKGADRLIPLLRDLSEGALKETAERMQELGVSPDALTQVESLDNALDDLGRDAKLVGLAFAGELAPDIQRVVRAIAGVLEGPGVESVQDFAQAFSVAMKIVSAVALLAAESVRAAFALIWTPIETAAVVGTRIIQARYAEALEELKKGAKKLRDEAVRQATFERQRQILGDVFFSSASGRGRRAQGALVEPVEPDSPEELFRRREQFLSAALDGELKLVQARLRLEADARQRAFESGLTSVRDYYRQRRAILEKETAAEMSVLVRRLLIERTNPDEIARRKNLLDIESKLSVLRVEESAKRADLVAEELKTARELGEQRLDFIRRQLEFQGQRHASAMLDLEAEAEALDAVLKRQGVPDDERTRQVDEFLAAGRARLLFDELDRQIQQSLNDLASERRIIEEDIAAGRISEVEGEQEIIELQSVRLQQIRAIAEAQLAAARATGDEAAIRRATENLAAIDRLGIATDRLAVKMKNLGREIARAGLDSLTDALANIGRSANPVLDFFESFIRAVQRLAAELLALQLFKALGLGSLIGLKDGGRVQKKAAGGRVTGPGTGTSDSIPARLSAGEFVVRAAAVRQPGVLPHLEQLNALQASALEALRADPGMIRRQMNLRLLAPHEYVRPVRMAEGGLVGGAAREREGGAPLTGTLTFVLPDGVGMDIEAPENVRKLIRVVAKNPRAFRHAQQG